MSKITAYAALTSVASGDLLPVVDISDPSMGATGTTKNITVANLTALTTQLDSNSGDIQPPGTVSAGTSALAARADHVHASATIAPSDVGLISWTGDPWNNAAPAGAQPVGKLDLCMFWIRKTATLSTIGYAVSTGGTALTATQNLIGIYNSAGTLMGQTGDQSTNQATPGTYSPAITSPFSAAPGAYWVAFLANGTTGAALRGSTTLPLFVQLNQTAAQSRVGLYSSGLTALPATITPSSIVQAGANLYTAVLY